MCWTHHPSLTQTESSCIEQHSMICPQINFCMFLAALCSASTSPAGQTVCSWTHLHLAANSSHYCSIRKPGVAHGSSLSLHTLYLAKDYRRYVVGKMGCFLGGWCQFDLSFLALSGFALIDYLKCFATGSMASSKLRSWKLLKRRGSATRSSCSMWFLRWSNL